MLDLLRRPLSAGALLALVTAVAAAVAIYCMGYTWLAGRPETLAEALGWALANICPWLVAIELGKRAVTPAELAATVAGALVASLSLGYLLGSSADPLQFELWRRVPALAATLAAIALLRSGVGRPQTNNADIPLLPRQIDWVRAAGNYVELRAGERTIVHRGSISAAERKLAEHGFVRIHRSTLVRRDRIARVRGQDVVLHDGTHLPIGKRYRAALAA